MDPDRNAERRRLRIATLDKTLRRLGPTEAIYYVDSSPGEEAGGVTAVVGPCNEELTTIESDIHSTDDLETRAIARAINCASKQPHTINIARNPPHNPVPTIIITDSQAACRQIATNHMHPRTIRIISDALIHTTKNFYIMWVPGHGGLPGNERAHALARALLYRVSGQASQTSNGITPLSETPSFDARAHLASFRSQRKLYPPPHKTLNRRQSTLLRQVQTGTLPTTHLTHRFLKLPGSPTCPYCGAYPNIYHPLWACSRHPRLTPILDPTPTSWEERLADSSADGQILLVARAEAALTDPHIDVLD